MINLELEVHQLNIRQVRLPNRTKYHEPRKDDLIFRWGGEEFLLLLPRTSLDTALNLAEVIRATVAKVTLPGLPRFTVSIGVARHETNESIDELFKRVDDALYKAKNEGRNRVLAA